MLPYFFIMVKDADIAFSSGESAEESAASAARPAKAMKRAKSRNSLTQAGIYFNRIAIQDRQIKMTEHTTSMNRISTLTIITTTITTGNGAG